MRRDRNERPEAAPHGRGNVMDNTGGFLNGGGGDKDVGKLEIHLKKTGR